MKKNKKKIVIATGGTGGHIFPSISLADYLTDDYKVIVTTDLRGFKYIKNYKNAEIKIINSKPILSKNLLKVFFGFFTIIFSLFDSLIFLIKQKPKLIIGMGGYSSFSICFAAFILSIPIILYENNLVIGKVNKFLLPFAKKIAVSTENIKGLKNKNKVSFSGYLLRKEIFTIQKNHSKFEKKDLSILIIGGSQSAKIFSELLPSVLIKCHQNGIKFQVFQQCLEEQQDKIKDIYKRLNFDFKLFSFSESPFEYYKNIDFAISRSGASSLAELINLRIPFITIPLPSSADNHQFENALYFEKKGYCFLIEEKFIHDKLFNLLKELNQNRNKLLLFKKNMGKHSDKDSLFKIKKLIKKVLNV